MFRPDEFISDADAPPTRGEKVYREHCAQCHAPNRRGVGMYPPLMGLHHRMNDDKIKSLLLNGKNAMPAIDSSVPEDDIDALVDYLMYRDGAAGTLKEPDPYENPAL